MDFAGLPRRGFGQNGGMTTTLLAEGRCVAPEELVWLRAQPPGPRPHAHGAGQGRVTRPFVTELPMLAQPSACRYSRWAAAPARSAAQASVHSVWGHAGKRRQLPRPLHRGLPEPHRHCLRAGCAQQPPGDARVGGSATNSFLAAKAALNNAVKHGRPARLRLSLATSEHRWTREVGL